jgi:hypothetical protein
MCAYHHTNALQIKAKEEQKKREDMFGLSLEDKKKKVVLSRLPDLIDSISL